MFESRKLHGLLGWSLRPRGYLDTHFPLSWYSHRIGCLLLIRSVPSGAMQLPLGPRRARLPLDRVRGCKLPRVSRVLMGPNGCNRGAAVVSHGRTMMKRMLVVSVETRRSRKVDGGASWWS